MTITQEMGRAIPRGILLLTRHAMEPSADPSFSPPRTFARTPTVLAGFVVLGFAALLTWWTVGVPPLEKVDSPERALPLLVGDMMEFRELFPQMAPWERAWWYGRGTPDDDVSQAIAWYDELARASGDAVTAFRTFVLEAETGRLDEARARLREWERGTGPFPSYARLIAPVYFTQTPLEDSARSFQAHLIDLLPAGWLRDRFLIRLGTRLDDAAMRAEGERALRARMARVLWWNRLWAVAQLCLVAAGGMALWWGLRRRNWVIAASPLPPPWRASAAATVLLRGWAVGILLAGLVVVAGMALGIGEAFVTFILDPLLFLPALLMVRAHLLRPSGIGMREGFGLSVPPARWRQVAITVLGAVAISFLGDWMLGSIQGALGWSSHWTEWFDPELAWGSPVAVSCSLIGSVIVGPVFEELTFRGIVFGACRRRFRWGLAALLSAALFGLVHGYDVIGFLSTFWSGLIWASLYEATGSLLPGMIAHGLNNLLVSVNLMLMRLA